MSIPVKIKAKTAFDTIIVSNQHKFCEFDINEGNRTDFLELIQVG